MQDARIEKVVIEADAPEEARPCYADALGLGDLVEVRPGSEPTTGFRGATLSLVVAQPATVDQLVTDAVAAGARVVKQPTKSLWGYGGTVEAPDGTVVTLASSSKKNTGPVTRDIDEVILQLGVTDVGASRSAYAERGFTVAKSYGRKYVTFDTGRVTLALLKRKLLAKNAGVPVEGSGSRRLVVRGGHEAFRDPDGFVWEAATESARS